MLNASTFTDWSSSIFFIFTFKSKKSAGLPLIFSLWRSGILFHIYQKAGGPRLWRVNGGNGALSSPEVSLLFSAGLWGHLRQATDSSSGNCCIIASEKVGWVRGGRSVLLPGTQSFLLSSDFYLLFEVFAFQDWLVKSVVGQDRTAKVSVEKWIYCLRLSFWESEYFFPSLPPLLGFCGPVSFPCHVVFEGGCSSHLLRWPLLVLTCLHWLIGNPTLSPVECTRKDSVWLRSQTG